MRTKVIVCAAALAASLASSMAQNVYSLNVVGYVNVTLPANAFSLVANPLDASSGGTIVGGNDITNLFKGMADSSTIQTWDPAGFGGLGDFSASTTYIGGIGWDAQLQMPPGKGVLLYNAGPALSVTFVGNVVQGPYTVATLNSGSFAMVGSPVPMSGSVTNSTSQLGLVPADSDTIQKWDPAGFGGFGDWTAADTFIAGPNVWDPGTLTIGPGEGFFYYRSGATTTWQSNFTVQ